MEFRVNKNSDFPIYQQLKEQIRFFLLSGALRAGTRLPPPKDLASFLQINRNTVIAAYKELEKEGLLVTRHGQGTYVADSPDITLGGDRRQALIKLVDEAVGRAVSLGFTPGDLFTVIFNQVVLGVDSPAGAASILLVECNRPDLDFFGRELQSELGIRVEGCLLSELGDSLEEDRVAGADFVVTTFFHLEDVRAILEPLGKEVMAVMAAPHLHTLIRLGQLPAGTRVGLICSAESGACNMMRALEGAGISHVTLEHAGLDNREALHQMLKRVDLVVISRVALEGARGIIPPHVQVMEYYNVLDQAGVQLIKQYLEKRKQAGLRD